MIWSIAVKEFLDNLLNLRFTVGLLLCVILVFACVTILTSDYRQRMASHHALKAMEEEFIGDYAAKTPLALYESAVKPPGALHPFITGLSPDGRNNSFSFYANPVPALFPTLDLVFIVSVLLSLLAVLFSYDSFSGERERGTLRLVAANQVSRAKILAGKWLGGIASLLVPFFVSIVLGALYVIIQPDIRWDDYTLLTLLLVLGVSVTLISVFYLLGLLVSSSFRYSSSSLITAVFLWVLFVLVVPSLSPYLAEVFHPVHASRKEQEYNRLRKERDEKEARLIEECNEVFGRKYGQLFREYREMSGEERQQKAASDPEFGKMREAYLGERKKIQQETLSNMQEGIDKVNQELKDEAEKQKRTAKNLAAVSPYSDFLYAVTDLTETGLHNMDYFKRISSEYENIIDKYREIKGIPQRLYYDGSALDFSDHPRFTYREEPLRERLAVVLPWWGMLIVFNVVFFAGAFTAFLRYDVR